jgi:methionine-rich copper-binding protein CopC
MLVRLMQLHADSRPGFFKRIRQSILLGCLVLLGGMLAAHNALAHARLVESIPADRSHTSSPSTITLTFNEPVKPIFVRLKHGGRNVDSALAAAAVEGVNLTAALMRTLEQGDYVIEYRVVTADTHPVSGTVSFHVD